MTNWKCKSATFHTNKGLFDHCYAKKDYCYLHYLTYKYLDEMYGASKIYKKSSGKGNQTNKRKQKKSKSLFKSNVRSNDLSVFLNTFVTLTR